MLEFSQKRINQLDSATFMVLVPASACHCLRLRTIEPHQKTHPQPPTVLCCERTAALLGVVVAENVWNPHSNSKQWHALRVNVAAQNGAVQLGNHGL